MSEKTHKNNRVTLWLPAIAIAAFFATIAGAAPNMSSALAWTISDISTHNSASDCWMVIDGKVYNMTSYVPSHPGGAAIIPFCGLDATDAFAGQPMHSYATGLLPTYYIGDLAAPDTIAPTITISSPSNTTYTNAILGLNYTTIDNAGGSGVNLSACSYKLDSGAMTPLANCSNATLASISNGIHTVTVYSADNAGNQANASVSFNINVTVPPQAPAITVLSPENKTYDQSSVILNASFQQPVDTAWIVLDNGAAQNFTNNVSGILLNISGLSDGAHSIYVYANNSLGLENHSAVFFTVNTTSITPPSDDGCEHKDKKEMKDNGKHKGEKEHKECKKDKEDDDDELESHDEVLEHSDYNRHKNNSERDEEDSND